MEHTFTPRIKKILKMVVLFGMTLLTTYSFAQDKKFSLPGDGKWYRVAGGAMGYIKYSYVHHTPHNPASATGEIHFVNYHSTPSVQVHHVKGYASYQHIKFAILDRLHWCELWVKATSGVDTAKFEILESKGVALYLGNASSSDLSDVATVRPIRYSKLPMNGHLYSGNIIVDTGSVGIGTSKPDAKLTVKGKIHAEEVKVDLSVPGPDYVFDENYALKPLGEVKAHIQTHGRLPDISSAAEMEAGGIKLGEMSMSLLKKIEELTLYAIAQEERLEKQAQDIAWLKKENETVRLMAERLAEVEKQVNEQ